MKKSTLSKGRTSKQKTVKRQRESQPRPDERPPKKTKGSSSDERNRSMREVYVSSKSMNKWQKNGESTVKFVMDIIESNIELTLGSVEAEEYEEICTLLFSLRDRLKSRFTKLSVPVPKVSNYDNLNKAAKMINTELVQNMQQMNRIDAELEEVTRSTKKLEKKKRQLEEALGNTTQGDESEEEDSSCQQSLISTLQTIISHMEREQPTESEAESDHTIG